MKSPKAIAALGLLGVLVCWKGPAIASGVTQQAYNLIENAGSALTRRSTINCTGTITCSDDSANNRTEINGAAGATAPAGGTKSRFHVEISIDPSTGEPIEIGPNESKK